VSLMRPRNRETEREVTNLVTAATGSGDRQRAPGLDCIALFGFMALTFLIGWAPWVDGDSTQTRVLITQGSATRSDTGRSTSR
jgi:hypothetical protein